MKKKGTRKIRKNKRTTQRRKNRSYKRMKGGMFNFKSKGFFASKKPIPEDVKNDIDTYTNNGKLYSRNFDDIKVRYSKVINTTDSKTTTIYEKYGEGIKEKMIKFTKNTGEPSLTTLPFSTASVEQLIESLKQLGFLPDVTEFEQLYNKFYGINEKGVMEPGKAEKNTKHSSPFKFNGFALAVFLVSKYNDQHYDDIKSKSTELSSLLSTPNPDMPQSFGILQSYLFELGPTDQLFWRDIPDGTKVTENPFCPFRGRIRYIKYGDSESQVTNTNRSWLKYGMKPCAPSEAGQLSSYFTEMNRLAELGIAIKSGETTSVRYRLHEVLHDTTQQDGKFSEPKYKMYVSRIEIKNIDMTNFDFEKKSLVDRPMTSYIPVIVITIYEYDEDGMINKVLVTYKFFEITTSKPDLTSLTDITDRYGKKINLNDRVYREVVTDMETNLRLRLRPSETLEGMLEKDTFISIHINANRGDTSTPTVPPVYTLYMTHTPSTSWTAKPASRIQNIAFNAVNHYIQTSKWIMSNPVKRFLIKNDDKKDNIAVVIEVKELTSANKLKRVTYCGEEMSEYELFDTEQNAESNAEAKLANYNQVTSSGPIGI